MNNFFHKTIATILIVLSLIGLFPIKSLAHDAYFLQVLIDENTLLYQGNVVKDSVSGLNAESKHIELVLGNFKNIKNQDVGISHSYSSSDNKDGEADPKEAMIFTFQPHEVKEGWIGNKRINDASQVDINKAYEIRDSLVSGMNDALRVINGGKRFDDMDSLVSASKKLSSGGSVNFGNGGGSWNVKYNSPSNNEVTISQGEAEYTFKYKMDVGYHDKESPLYNPDIKDPNKSISWQQLMYQGNFAYEVKNHTTLHAKEYTKPSTLEVIIVEFVQNAINDIRNLLGLYSTNELVFNDGTRGSRAFYMGTMNREWMDNSVKSHILFQAFAWSIIGFAIIKHIMQQNYSTINPSVRVNLIESIKDLLITAFFLANVFPIINLLLYLNLKIVDIFGAAALNFDNLSANMAYSTGFGGLIMQIFYMIVNVYLNYLYIIRGIMLAALIASAPFFISCIGMGGQWKQLFSSWWRELVGNIFIQSFHAFILSFLVSIQLGTRGIEGLVVAFALIPLTEFFRNMVLGQSGGLIENLSKRATTATAQVGKELAESAGGVAMDTGSAAATGRLSTSNGTANRNNSYSAYGGGNLGYKDSSSIPGVNTKEGSHRKEHSVDIPNFKTTKEALQNKENMDNYETAMSELKLKEQVNSPERRLSQGTSDFLKTSGKTAVGLGSGAAKMAAGAGVMLALGGSGEGGRVGQQLMSDGASGVKNAIGGASIPLAIKGGEIASNLGNQISASMKQKNGASNILGAETLSNGDTVIHRNKAMLQNDGIADARKDSSGNLSVAYNSHKLSEANRANLESMENAYSEAKNTGNFDVLKAQGIERMSVNDKGQTVVTYNPVGQERMGLKDAYTTASRMVETKSPTNQLDTNWTYKVSRVNETANKPIPTIPSHPNIPNENKKPEKPKTVLDDRI